MAQPTELPSCEVVTLDDGRTACAYTNIQDVKAVYLADAELEKLRGQAVLLREAERLCKERGTEAAAAMEAEQRASKLLEARNAELASELLEKDRLYQDARVANKGTSKGWWVAATLGLILTGLVGGAAL